VTFKRFSKVPWYDTTSVVFNQIAPSNNKKKILWHHNPILKPNVSVGDL